MKRHHGVWRTAWVILLGTVGLARAGQAPLRADMPLNGTWHISSIKTAHHRFSIEEEMKSGAWRIDADMSGWGDIELPTLRGYIDRINPKDLPQEAPGQSYWFAKHAKHPTYANAWYRRKFDTPNLDKGQRLLLHFMDAAWESHVWVNGKKAGDHLGSFTGFALDITDLVNPPGQGNVIAVNVGCDFGEYPVRHVYGKMFFAHSNMGGIIGPVELRIRPGVRIQRAMITPHVDGGTIEVECRMTNDSGRARTVSLEAEVRPHGQQESSAAQTVKSETWTIPPGGSAHTFSIKLNDPALWSPDRPQLYDLHLKLSERGALLDQMVERFGYRSFEAKGDRFFLNGRRIRLYLGNVLTFGQFKYYGPADQTRFRQWLRRQKKAGVNTIRYHMGAVDSYQMLRLCDEEGMLVVDEWPWFHRVETKMPNAGAREVFFRNNDREMAAWIERDYNSPSNIIWSLSNEVWTPGEVELLEHAYKHLRPLDRSTRPMLTDSGFFSVMKTAALPTDIYDFHNYSMQSAYPWSLMHESIDADLGTLKQLFGKIDKPVTVLESLALNRSSAVTKAAKAIKGPITPEIYVANAQLPYVREIGLRAALDPARGYRYWRDTFSKRVLEAFRQEPQIQGFSAWFQTRDELPENTRFLYGPYYVGIHPLAANIMSGRAWNAPVVVMKDPTATRKVRVELKITGVGDKPLWHSEKNVALRPDADRTEIDFQWDVPAAMPTGWAQATLRVEDERQTLAENQYRLFVMNPGDYSSAVKTSLKVGVYEPPHIDEATSIRPLLDQAGVTYGLIKSTEILKNFNVVILDHGWGGEISKWGEALSGWIANGGRLLALETDQSLSLPWADGYQLIHGSKMRQPFVDLVTPKHPVFAGLYAGNFDGWNGMDRLLVDTMISPLSVNALAAAGSYSDGQLSAVMEAQMGKGSFVISQLKALDRRQSDPVVARYLHNLLSYALRDNVSPVRPLHRTLRGALRKAWSLREGEKAFTVDLSAFVNAPLKGLFGDSSALDLRRLPTGRQSFFGIPFDIIRSSDNGGKAAMVMQGNRTPARPGRVSGIPVNHKAVRLMFLQTAYYASNHMMAHYVVHYADGTQVKVPVDGAVNVGDWYRPRDKPQALVAWSDGGSAVVGVYLTGWTNPRPAELIQSIDVISEGSEQQSGGSLVLLGITGIETPG